MDKENDEPDEPAPLPPWLGGDLDKWMSYIFKQYYALALTIADDILGDWHLAKDVVATLFLRIHKNWDKYDPKKGKFESWLGAIARYAAYDAARRRRRGPEMVPLLDPEGKELSHLPGYETGLNDFLVRRPGLQVRLFDLLRKIKVRNREIYTLALTASQENTAAENEATYQVAINYFREIAGIAPWNTRLWMKPLAALLGISYDAMRQRKSRTDAILGYLCLNDMEFPPRAEALHILDELGMVQDTDPDLPGNDDPDDDDDDLPEHDDPDFSEGAAPVVKR